MAVKSQVLVGRHDGGYLVQVIGQGTMRQSPAFREFVEQCFCQGGGPVTVDMSRCDYLDSTFLGCLVGLEKRCEHDRDRFVIAADRAARIRLFSTTVLDRYLQFIDDSPMAISELIDLDTPELAPQELGRHVMHSHRQLAGLDCKDADKFRSIADRLQDELGDSTIGFDR